MRRSGAAGPTRMLFIRHGEVHNPDDIEYGRLPRWRLSHLGRDQARRAAQLVAGEPVAAIYTSPQLRARQTARLLLVAHPSARIRTSALLAETRLRWQGLPRAMLPPREALYALLAEPEDETLLQIFSRMRRFVELAARRHPGQTVVAVSHGDPIKLLAAGLRGLPIEPATACLPLPAPCSITAIEALPDGEVGVVTRAHAATSLDGRVE